MQLTHITQIDTIDADHGAAAGMEGGIVLDCSVGSCRNPQTVQNGFQFTLEREEVFLSTVGSEGQHLGLFRLHLTFYGQIDLCQLVELGSLVVVCVVPCQNVQHGGQSYGTHDGSVFAQRILNLQRAAQRRIGRQTDLIEDRGGDEGIGDDLAVAHGTAQNAGLALHHHEGRITALGGSLECGGGDVVEAEGTADLFRNVSHQVQVGTERGNQNVVAFHRNFQTAQIFDHHFLGNLGAQQMIDLFGLQLDNLGLRNVVDDIDGAVHDITGIQHFHQFAGTLHGGNGHHGIQALLKLAGGIGTHTQSQSGLTDGSAVEVCGFKDHGGGVILDFGIFTAHDACQTDGLVLIGNDQHAGLQITDIAVQSGQGFAFHGFPDHDLAGTDIAVVKCVHGLAILQHDIVGDIHNVVDGTDAVGSQTLTHPLGGRTDLDIGNHPCGVAVAQLLGGNFHIQLLEDGVGIAAVDHRLVVLHGQIESSSSFPGQTDDGEAVGTVVGDFKVNHGVIVADHQIDVFTDGAVLIIQNPDAVLEDAGQIVFGQTQFFVAAEHAVGLFASQLALGDVNAAGQPGIVQGSGNQIALMDVLGTSDDLNGLFLAHIHLADKHMVRVGMGNDADDLADNHVFDLGIHPLVGFHLLAEHGQSFYKIFIGYMAQVHEILVDPFSVQSHVCLLLRTGSGTGRRCRRSDAGH